MFQVGTKINNGTMSVAQEHALSELIKKNIRKIYDELEPADNTLKPEKTLLFATPENHLHEFAVLMAAVLCRFHGFKTHYLGSNLPAAALISAAKTLKAHAIVLGFSPLITPESKTSSIQFMNELRKNTNTSLMFWLGGSVPKMKYENFKQQVWRFDTLEELDKRLSTP